MVLGVVAVVALGAFSVLATLRVGTMQVEIDAAATQLTFEPGSAGGSTAHIQLRSFGTLEPLERVVWPTSRTAPRQVLANERFAVRALTTKTEHEGEIYLQAIKLPLDTVRVRTSAAGLYRLDIMGIDTALSLTVHGSVSCPGRTEAICHFDQPRTVTMLPRDGRITVELEIIEPITFATRLMTDHLDFAEVHRLETGDALPLQRTSTIRGGSVFFESLGGEELQLRPFQRLDLAGIDGMIRRLELGESTLNVNYIGQVAAMATGIGGAERTLMPSYLNWLRSRETLALLWGTILLLFGLYQMVIKVWDRTK